MFNPIKRNFYDSQIFEHFYVSENNFQLFSRGKGKLLHLIGGNRLALLATKCSLHLTTNSHEMKWSRVFIKVEKLWEIWKCCKHAKRIFTVWDTEHWDDGVLTFGNFEKKRSKFWWKVFLCRMMKNKRKSLVHFEREPFSQIIYIYVSDESLLLLDSLFMRVISHIYWL